MYDTTFYVFFEMVCYASSITHNVSKRNFTKLIYVKKLLRVFLHCHVLNIVTLKYTHYLKNAQCHFVISFTLVYLLVKLGFIPLRLHHFNNFKFQITFFI